MLDWRKYLTRYIGTISLHLDPPTVEQHRQVLPYVEAIIRSWTGKKDIDLPSVNSRKQKIAQTRAKEENITYLLLSGLYIMCTYNHSATNVIVVLKRSSISIEKKYFDR